MRKEFAQKIAIYGQDHENLIFISGDLGYMALENVKSVLGERFINAGVAEQNMISVAAGMAKEGFSVFTYSIAPFIVYRPLEQIRNDVCFHQLPVCLVGNGGGYGYGIMGSSHHCLEDIAVLSGLPNMQCFVPCFIEDLESIIDHIIEEKRPAYLRLGLGKKSPFPFKATELNPCIYKGENVKITVFLCGPVGQHAIEALLQLDSIENADIFLLNHFPLKNLSNSMQASLEKTKKVLVVEEHVEIGGAGSQLSYILLTKQIQVDVFISICAKGYPSGTYGNQAFHQEESGLDTESIKETLLKILN
jgi:transketolase